MFWTELLSTAPRTGTLDGQAFVIIAIGDIHGCADELRILVDKLPLDKDPLLVFLGDYVDRGPDSREVVDFIIDLRRRHRVVALMGNHEAMFLDFINDPHSVDAGAFIFNGGSATLASYGDDRGNYNIPDDHIEFLQGLQLWHETEDYFFVHAGVPDVPLSEITSGDYKEHMLWMRGKFLASQFHWGKVIVHGHTPVTRVAVTPNRINLDTGCVYNHRLSAMSFPDRELFSVHRRQASKPVYLRDHHSQRVAIRFEGVLAVLVQRADDVFMFETINYSEAGMYMRDLANPDRLVLGNNELIDGIIGNTPDTQLGFKGRVVRRRLADDGAHYAVQILSKT